MTTLGRPRDDSIDIRIAESTLDLLNQEGLGGLSVEGIASHAGVSKATIYRRWHSKDELLVDVIAGIGVDVTVPDSGDVRTDLLAAVRGMRQFVYDTRGGELFPWLVGEIAAGSDIGRRYESAVIVPRRAMLSDLISKAIDRGELRAHLDGALAVDMLTGSVIIRRMLGRLDDTEDSWTEDLVDSLLSGWRS